MSEVTRRHIAHGALAAALATALPGCRPAQQRVVRFTVRTGIEATGLRLVAQQFTGQTGIRVEINELGRDGYMSTVPTQLISGTSSADVVLLPSTMIPELAVAKALAPLGNLVTLPGTDLVATYGYRGQVYAIPSDISSMFLFYRKDLIPQPPTTWSDLMKVAAPLSQRRSAGSPTRYGLAFSGAPGEDLPKTFYNLLWSAGGDIVRDGAVVIDSPEGVAAAQIFRSLVDERVVPPDVTSWGFTQVYEALTSGAAAMAGPFWNATTTLLADGKTRFGDRIGYTLIPSVRRSDGTLGRVPFQHAWTLAINARSRQSEAAAKFVSYVISPAGARLYAEKGGGNPALYSILESPDLAPRRPDFGLLSQSLRLARAEPATPAYAAMHSIMNDVLLKLLTGALQPASAMAEAQRRLAALRL